MRPEVELAGICGRKRVSPVSVGAVDTEERLVVIDLPET